MTVAFKSPKFAAIGECMLELSEAPDSGTPPKLQLGYGGDTLNTALYCARLGVEAHYVTALGEDARSQWLIDEWRGEGLGVSHVVRIPNRQPGLYWITTDAKGERSFSYWRGESAARQLLSADATLTRLSEALVTYGLVYFSGITLSLFDQQGLERLWTLLRALRGASVRIAFDGNYRPRAWASKERAQSVFETALRHSDIALPTFDDEQQLFDDKSPSDTLERIHHYGVSEVVLKVGPEGCWVSGDVEPQQIKGSAVTQPVDTTAAGDSFNAGYLSGRLHNDSMLEAAHLGNRLAEIVIGHRGAIVPRSAMSHLNSLPRR